MKCPKCGSGFSFFERIGGASYCRACSDRQFVKDAPDMLSGDPDLSITRSDINEADAATLAQLRCGASNNLLLGSGIMLLGWLIPLLLIVKGVEPLPIWGMIALAAGLILAGAERLLRGFGQHRLARVLKRQSHQNE
jgi:hypothetical protein